MPLTESEKLIWAAAYAAEWSRQCERQETTGMKMYVPTCVENAWAAVDDARKSLAAVKDGWGENDEVTTMLKQMVQTEGT